MGLPIAPERRTRLDLIVTAVLVVATVVVGVLVWTGSSARGSASDTAATAPEAPQPAEASPNTLEQAWTAPSAATTVPQLTAASVVVADGGTVRALDPATGKQRWRYHRDLPLCGALAAWPGGEDLVVSVYRNSRGCSEVTALNGGTGLREAQRSSDADDAVSLSVDGDYVVSAGSTRLETWGSNLVRGIEYGRVDAPVNPEVAPDRSNCRLYSALPGANRVAVVERCDGDFGYRLTVLGSAEDSDEKIVQWGTTMLTQTSHGPAPRLVAGGPTSFSVYDPGTDATGEVGRAPGQSVRVFTPEAEAVSVRPVAGIPDPRGSPSVDSGVVMFATGRSTLVLDGNSGNVMFEVPGAIGTGAVMAGDLLLPMPGRISVRQLSDGREVRSIPVDRGEDTDVALRVLGDTVVEQRGSTVVGLR
ncbi:Rv3212 family protein [Gordonia sp. (in: high G+C Gram-positive bacteria)]|uniref:Rv3212 family protein n=1 Tax=Gordonia sp. (in: high G+C Gram-positive bacteria) TaxID=84139 RepID=UPI003F9C176B